MAQHSEDFGVLAVGVGEPAFYDGLDADVVGEFDVHHEFEECFRCCFEAVAGNNGLDFRLAKFPIPNIVEQMPHNVREYVPPGILTFNLII